jgi:anti-sigma factor ChrR (cupin superfamily)
VEKLVHDELANQAEVFLLGLLEHSEEKKFLTHLASGCAECNATVAATSRVIRALPFAVDSQVAVAVPPSTLKDRLLRSIKIAEAQSSSTETSAAFAGSVQQPADKGKSAGPQVWKTWTNKPEGAKPVLPGLFALGAREGTWEDIGINGIKVKRLFVDPQRDSVTMLVRMPAGAAYPRHRHAAPEQCYVLEGDLRVDNLAFYAGDYQYAAPNSIHGVQYTKDGCLLLIVSSLHDELVEEHQI